MNSESVLFLHRVLPIQECLCFFFGSHILLFTLRVSFNEEDERMDGWMVVWTSTLFILSLFCLFPSGAL